MKILFIYYIILNMVSYQDEINNIFFNDKTPFIHLRTVLFIEASIRWNEWSREHMNLNEFYSSIQNKILHTYFFDRDTFYIKYIGLRSIDFSKVGETNLFYLVKNEENWLYGFHIQNIPVVHDKNISSIPVYLRCVFYAE